MHVRVLVPLLAVHAWYMPVLAQSGSAPPAGIVPTCSACDEWNTPQRPFQIYGNTYYVGPRGLGSILVTSPEGHVLIDGALPESTPLIIDNIRALGFRVEDIRLILNSHAHFDHAGGIAALQRASGAEVAASPSSRLVLLTGVAGPDDPQHGALLSFPAVQSVREIGDGETLRVGALALTARFTPGHTPGGTTWTWRSCEGDRCVSLVYADSQTPVSAKGFEFTRSRHYPTALADFDRGHAVLEAVPCDILVTTHPGASDLWARLEGREHGAADALIDSGACRRYVANAREQLARRVERERAGL